jgi:trimethylamine-N-oxide reductase (cytochrome c)
LKEEEIKKEEKKQTGEVSRRDFLVGAGTVVVGGAIGAGILSSCDSGDGKTITTTKTVDKVSTITIGEGTPVTVTETVQVGDGQTVTSTTTKTETVGDVEPAFEPEESVGSVPGGDCSEKAMIDVKNGKIVRIRPLHYDERYTQEEIAPSMWDYTANHRVTGQPMTLNWRMQSSPCYLQLPYKKRVYSPNRVKYPLQRVDWEPGGVNVNSQNRGKSKFKRISWEEATSIIAGEIKRVQDTYGPNAVLDKGDSCHREYKVVQGSFCSAIMSILLRNIGASQSIRNADSWEGYYYGTIHVWGNGGMGMLPPTGAMSIGFGGENILVDFSENTEMIIYQGCDWDTTAAPEGGGWRSRTARWFNRLGIKQVYIAPDLNFQNASNPDKWIPVIPGRDDALLCAVIHTWLKEDTWDKEYVATHVAEVNGRNGMEYIEDYIMGRSDDMVEKTPEWAAPRCGIPEWTIKALAREWAKKKTSTAHYVGGAGIRGPFTHEYTRLESVCLGMQGLGRPGVTQASAPVAPHQEPAINSMAISRMFESGAFAYPPYSNQIVSKVRVPTAILNGHEEHWGTTSIQAPAEDQFVKYTYPIAEEDGGTRVHLIWQDHACHSACWNDSNQYIKAMQDPSIECNIIQHIWMENDCLFADIILPISTNFEEEDILGGGSDQTALIYHKAAVDPIGESKTDYETVLEVARKLEEYGGRYEGLYNKCSGGKTVDEWMMGAFENTGAGEFITWEEFKEKGYFLSKTSSDWKEEPVGLKFYEDPDNNPLRTPTGKLEFYSEALADNFPDDDERGPYPKYVCGGPENTHDESLVVEDGAERCKVYPLLMQSQHPRWRVHAQFDDIPWLREIPTCKVKGYDGYMYEAIWINPVDAEARGIKHGDIVKAFNERGIELGGAYVTERIKPGTVHMDHGAHEDMINCDPADYDDRGTKWVNRGGTCSNISPYPGLSKNAPGMVVSAFLVEVAKVTGDEMQTWRDNYPEAFERDYDPAYGLLFNAWVEGGK